MKPLWLMQKMTAAIFQKPNFPTFSADCFWSGRRRVVHFETRIRYGGYTSPTKELFPEIFEASFRESNSATQGEQLSAAI